jgi:translation initiation factor IF-1
MTKEDLVRMDGSILEVLPNGMFRVDIDGHQIIAYTAGSVRKNKIKIITRDRVQVEMSAYDLSKGRITYRYR